MKIQTEFISFKNCWIISSSYDFQAHRSVPKEDDVFSDCATVIWRAPRLVVGAPRCVVGAPRCSQACCRRSQVLPGEPEGHCIGPGNSGFWPPWDSGPTNLRHLHRLPEAPSDQNTFCWWCLSQLPITWISSGRTRAWLRSWCQVELGLVVDPGTIWKWWLRRRVTIPLWWWMKLIRGLPELSVFARCIFCINIWCSHILIWALFWAKQPTCVRHISCLRWRFVRRYWMWRNNLEEAICQFNWWFRMQRSIVENIEGSSNLHRNEGLLYPS